MSAPYRQEQPKARGKRAIIPRMPNGRRFYYRDISGEAFGRLTAVAPLPKRDRKGCIVWLCRCSCGNTVEVSYDRLVYSGILSCGCRKRDHDRALPGLIERADGTSISSIRGDGGRRPNATGVRGVYIVNGRYLAKIVFQGHQYHLGYFDTIEEASLARKEAENNVFGKAVRHYEAWKERAAADPEWAEANPVRFRVAKSPGSIRLECLPDIGDA